MYRVLVISDVHIPQEDKRSLSLFTQYLKDFKPDELIIAGDFLDFDEISSHNKENLRAVESKRLWYDYDEANALLDIWQLHAKKITLLEGNHENRVERYIDANPVLEGMIEVPIGLRLKQRGIKWVRSWTKGEVYKIGKARFIHGIYTNQYHAKKTVEAFGENIFYGHTHDVQSYSKEMKGDDKTIVGQSIGCMIKYNVAYMKGRPNKWQQAFAEFHFTDDGFFQYYIHRIFRHRLITKDKIYD